MTIAEIHGKLSPDRPYGCHERMEDLLTSDVFGTMRYLGGSDGFFDWLRTAEAPSVPQVRTVPPEVIPQSGVRAVHFVFWPTLPNGREPDVALLLELEDAITFLVLVEAKYLAGTSDYEAAAASDDALTGNQIADQVRALSKLSPDDIGRLFGIDDPSPLRYRLHLFVTTDQYLPLPVYRESQKHLAAPWPVSAYWLSWTSLAHHLESHRHQPDPGRAAMIEDVLALLRRKGLVPFSGFRHSAWRRAGVIPAFWEDMWWSLQALGVRADARFWTGG